MNICGTHRPIISDTSMLLSALLINVRYWHLVDIGVCAAHVCFLGQSDMHRVGSGCCDNGAIPSGRSLLFIQEIELQSQTPLVQRLDAPLKGKKRRSPPMRNEPIPASGT